MRLTINDNPIDDVDLLAAARDVVLAFDEGELEEEDDEQLDPEQPELGVQGTLAELADWSPWRAQLAVACAYACGCAVFVEDDDAQPIRLQIVGIHEDAEALRLTYRRMERRVKRAVIKACADKRPEWRATWAAAHNETVEHDINEVADTSLERAYRDHEEGVGLVFEEEGDPEDRAAAATAWMPENLATDALTVVPQAPPREVVNLAAFAGRSGR